MNLLMDILFHIQPRDHEGLQGSIRTIFSMKISKQKKNRMKI